MHHNFIYLHTSKKTSDQAEIEWGTPSTLFVANAIANGPIRTDLFLNAVFRRYPEVERVTVARDPRKSHDDERGFNASAATFGTTAAAAAALFARKISRSS